MPRFITLPLMITLLFACTPDQPDSSSKEEAQRPPADFISGTVRSPGGEPEAGVWVIAETDALATPFRKIVVTNQNGQFLLPDLPDVTYKLWARGYGVQDSEKASAATGETTVLTVAHASPQQAAAIYPASYWLSMLTPPEGDPNWVNNFKLGCQLCHQVGSVFTRIKNREQLDFGLHKSTFMNLVADSLGRDKLLASMADWHQRIEDGETPQMPPRPSGIEQNIVLTQWAWGDGFTYRT